MTAVQLHGQDLLQAAGCLGIKVTTSDVSAELGDSSQNEGGSTNLKRSQCIAMFNAMQCLSLKMISTNQQKYHFQVFICISVLLAASSAQIGGFGGAHGPVGHHGGPGVGHGGFGHGGHGGGHGGHGIGHGYGHEIHEIIPYHYNYAVADSYSGARFDQASSVMEVAMHFHLENVKQLRFHSIDFVWTSGGAEQWGRNQRGTLLCQSSGRQVADFFC